MRPLNRLSCLIAATFLIPTLNSSRHSENSTEATELLAQALKHEYIWATGSSSVDLQAKLELAVGDGKVATGDYTLLWVSPSQSREEINFANFNRTRVQQANGYWQKRNLNYQPTGIDFSDRQHGEPQIDP